MSGICSAHQHHEPGCRLCEVLNQSKSTTYVYVPPPDPDEFKVTGTCQNCQQRPATEWWVAEGGSLAFTHGMRAKWCHRCVVTEQLRFAREIAATIPKLEAELTELDK